MKTRKGILKAYLKIIILILIIIAAIYGIYKVASNSYSKEEFETIKTDLLLIQAQTEVIAQKVEIKEKDAKYIGTQVKEKSEDEKIQNLINNKVIDLESKDSNLYCLNNEDLKQLGLEDIQTKDYYIVDYNKNDVIYVDGIQNQDGNIVYKLSEME